MPDGANGPGEYSGMVEVGGWAKGREERSALGGGSGSEEYVPHSLQRGSREDEYSRGHIGGKGEKEPVVLQEYVRRMRGRRRLRGLGRLNWRHTLLVACQTCGGKKTVSKTLLSQHSLRMIDRNKD